MQKERIFEKAQTLGISIDANLSDEENLQIIASSFGIQNYDLNNLNKLENKLDNELASQYDDYPDYTESVYSEPNISVESKPISEEEKTEQVPETTSEGQKEAEKGMNWKKGSKENESGKQEEKPSVSNNKFSKAKEKMEAIQEKAKGLGNKINDVKDKISNPEEVIKKKAQAAINKAKTEAKKKTKDAIITFVKKNPYVVAAIVFIFFVILLIVIIAGGSFDMKNVSEGQIDEFCSSADINGFSLRSTPMSRSEFVDRAMEFFESNPSNYQNCQTVLKNQKALETIYDVSLEHNTSPEVTIARAIAEGCSPGTGIGYHIGHCDYDTVGKHRGVGDFEYDWDKSYNYWGIDTFTGHYGNGTNDWSCYAAIYNNLEEGVIAFSEIVSQFESATQMMRTYAGQATEEEAAAKAAGMAQIRDRVFYNNDSSQRFNCNDYYSQKSSSGSIVNHDTYWWPIGGSEVTYVNGKMFATGAPVSTRITAYFGGNDSVHNNLGKGGHGAIDIGASEGTYVIAAKAGTVEYPKEGDKTDYPNVFMKSDSSGKYTCPKGNPGNYVWINHGDGTRTQYQHLLANTITVKAGDHVDQGQVIGQVGSSGCSTGYHLHFAITVNGSPVNPLDYVSVDEPRLKTVINYSGNYPIDPNNSLYSNLEKLHGKSFEELLNENGKTVSEYNEFLHSEIEKAGIKTRSAVVASALTLIGSTAEMKYKISYQWGGKWEKLGARNTWGNPCGDNCYCSTFTGEKSYCTTNYRWYGLDCSGFTTWAIINGMQDDSITQITGSSPYNNTYLVEGDAVCKPGGLLYTKTNTHQVLVVGIDDENKRYIIAQANDDGVALGTISYNSNEYVCKNLDELYGE